MNPTHFQAFLNASSDMLEGVLKEASGTDPESIKYLDTALRTGAVLTLRAVFAPTTGLAQIQIDVVEPKGTTYTVLNQELQKTPLPVTDASCQWLVPPKSKPTN